MAAPKLDFFTTVTNVGWGSQNKLIFISTFNGQLHAVPGFPWTVDQATVAGTGVKSISINEANGMVKLGVPSGSNPPDIPQGDPSSEVTQQMRSRFTFWRYDSILQTDFQGMRFGNFYSVINLGKILGQNPKTKTFTWTINSPTLAGHDFQVGVGIDYLQNATELTTPILGSGPHQFLFGVGGFSQPSTIHMTYDRESNVFNAVVP